MQLQPYKSLLTMAKEKIQEAMAPVRAREMRKKAELEMAKIEGEMLENEATINDLTSKYPIDFKKLIDAIDDYALLERRHKQYQKVIDALFPDE